MSDAARGWKSIRVYLEMIKIEHSIFALPFAMSGMMWGSLSVNGTPWPGWRIFVLIVVEMISCLSSAMAWKRIVDRDIDAKNSRTKMRAIPAGLLSMRTVSVYFWFSVIVFLGAAAMLNRITLALSPVALLVTLGYSSTKKFTPLCHFVLGLSLGIAPAAAWIAVTGSFDSAVLPLVGAVMLWTAGFDIIYSLQDEEFDKENGLRSVPASVGKASALLVSRSCHVLAIGFLLLVAMIVGAGILTFVGIAFVSALILYEQSLVRPDDLRKVNLAFFTLNGCVSLGFFVFVFFDALQLTR